MCKFVHYVLCKLVIHVLISAKATRLYCMSIFVLLIHILFTTCANLHSLYRHLYYMCKFALLVHFCTTCTNLHSCKHLYYMYKFALLVYICTTCTNLPFLYTFLLHVQICTCIHLYYMCKFVLAATQGVILPLFI